MRTSLDSSGLNKIMAGQRAMQLDSDAFLRREIEIAFL